MGRRKFYWNTRLVEKAVCLYNKIPHDFDFSDKFLFSLHLKIDLASGLLFSVLKCPKREQIFVMSWSLQPNMVTCNKSIVFNVLCCYLALTSTKRTYHILHIHKVLETDFKKRNGHSIQTLSSQLGMTEASDTLDPMRQSEITLLTLSRKKVLQSGRP